MSLRESETRKEQKEKITKDDHTYIWNTDHPYILTNMRWLMTVPNLNVVENNLKN